jgi:hypothetical protein
MEIDAKDIMKSPVKVQHLKLAEEYIAKAQEALFAADPAFTWSARCKLAKLQFEIARTLREVY